MIAVLGARLGNEAVIERIVQGRKEHAIELEDSSVVFREPLTQPVVAFSSEDGEAVMNKSRRLEFGVERILDDRSSIEAMREFGLTGSSGT